EMPFAPIKFLTFRSPLELFISAAEECCRPRLALGEITASLPALESFTGISVLLEVDGLIPGV
ncbi:MAG: hypothetical protein WAM25_14380, partial [Candidatus Acidiferrales bacterium]